MALKLLVLTTVLFEIAVSTPLGPSITGLENQPFGLHTNIHEPAGLYGGHNITIDKAKYIGSILNSEGQLLGTAIILNNHWILTAAFCFYRQTTADVTVRVGSSYVDKQGKTFNFKKILHHPKYEGWWDYDVALAKLAKPLRFSKVIGSVAVSDSHLPKDKSVGVTSGFGWVNPQGSQGYLQQVSLPVSSYATCKSRLPKFFSNLNFCTSKEGAGPCFHDFGSPLVYKNKVIGIFLGTLGCGKANSPSVFADMAKYKSWIDATIKKHTEDDEILEYSNDFE